MLIGIASGATNGNHVDATVTAYTLLRDAVPLGTDWPTPGSPLDPVGFMVRSDVHQTQCRLGLALAQLSFIGGSDLDHHWIRMNRSHGTKL